MIDVKNLNKKFGDHVVLDDISITLNSGEMVAVIGSSGSGKSTLLRCINQLETPDSGEILINGKHITKRNLTKLRQKLGMVFQQFHLFPHLTTLQNIEYAPRVVLKKTKAKAAKRGLELLEMVGLQDRADHYPHQLSGGQKQRVAIARALAMSPECILFDEPTSALDPENIGEVIETITNVAKRGITCLIVTHSMRLARKCQRVIFLDQGKIIEDSPADAFFSSPKTKRAKEFLALIDG